jgi:AcrR family transcriptional regulator
MAGLRNRKKQQTHDALSEAAIALFLERGFDQVSVADIAAAANVSKPTLFKYFATKQDLVLHRIADHAHESARLLQAATATRPTTTSAPPNATSASPGGTSASPGGTSASPGATSASPGGSLAPASAAGGRVAWAAGILRDEFLAGLERRDPVTGLNDHPEVLAYYRLVFETPTLAVRVQQFIAADQAALADALGNDLTAEVGAAQLISTQQVLARRNYLAMAAGISAAKQYRTARAEALTAYGTFPGLLPMPSTRVGV